VPNQCTWVLVILLPIFLGLFCCCQVRDEGFGNLRSTERLSDPQPVSQLPRHIEAPTGEISLVADYNDIAPNKVVVYLANRTMEPLRMPAQDSDVYMKLETPGPDGKWVRAQTHRFSGCGNSYHSIVVLPGQFRKLPGWYPANGQKKKVRFRIYRREGLTISKSLGPHDELISNIGSLPVSDEIVVMSRYDSMALRLADLDTLEAFLFKKVKLPDKDWKYDLNYALDRLSEFKQPRAVEMIERFLADDSLDEYQFQQSIASLSKIAPARMAAYAVSLIKEKSNERRSWMIKRLTNLNDKHSKEIDPLLIELARNPETKDLDGMLQFMASREVGQARQLLLDIQADNRYPETTRAKAGWLLAWTYSDESVELEFKFVNYDPGRGLQPPGHISVTITNKAVGPLSFSYRNPDDILALYLQADSKTYRLRRKKKITPDSSESATDVKLSPAKKHSLEVMLLSDYQLPDLDAKALEYSTLYMTFEKPGAGQIPVLSKYGLGLNMRK